MDRCDHEESDVLTEPAPGTSAVQAAALSILVTSPRVPAGVLSRSAWQVLEAADLVYAEDLAEPVPDALLTSGIAVQTARYDDPARLARMLAQTEGLVVWIGSADGDPGLTDALAGELTRLSTPPSVEIVVGSWDLPGARLLDAVSVMDTLRSPGGCPWDAEQTHDSLAKYLIEESHEVLEAIDSRDRAHLAEELGDVLLQVLFHSRIAAEDGREPFDIDDVAGGLVAKLVRRHPHVFADGDASTAAEVEASWEQIKAAEKPERDPDDLLAGIPPGLSTLLVAEKVLDRMQRRGLVAESQSPAGPGARLLRLIVEARAAGLSADTVLRREIRLIAAGAGSPGRDQMLDLAGGSQAPHPADDD